MQINKPGFAVGEIFCMFSGESNYDLCFEIVFFAETVNMFLSEVTLNLKVVHEYSNQDSCSESWTISIVHLKLDK